MKEIIDVYDDEVFKYKLYDALTEFGLYGTWPEDDGSLESKTITMFLQSLEPSIEKSSNYLRNASQSGREGGRRRKVSDEQIVKAIEECTKRLRRVPTRGEVVEEIQRLFDLKVDSKTISRRFPDAEKTRVAMEFL